MSTTAIQRAINIAGSQQNLAALANLTQPAIHFLTCGRNGKARFPRYQTAKKLSDAVGGVIAWHEFMEQVATQETPHGTGTEATEDASCPAHLESDRTGCATSTPDGALTETEYQQVANSSDTGVRSSASIPVANEQQPTIGR